MTHLHHSVNLYWLFNTQSRVPKADWFILDTIEKATLNIKGEGNFRNNLSWLNCSLPIFPKGYHNCNMLLGVHKNVLQKLPSPLTALLGGLDSFVNMIKKKLKKNEWPQQFLCDMTSCVQMPFRGLRTMLKSVHLRFASKMWTWCHIYTIFTVRQKSNVIQHF